MRRGTTWSLPAPTARPAPSGLRPPTSPRHPASAADLHHLSLGDQLPTAQATTSPLRRRRRRRHQAPQAAGTATSTGRSSAVWSGRSHTPARSASASSACSSTRTSGTSSWRNSSRARGRSSSATRSIRRRSSGRWSTARPRADPALGGRGGGARRQGPARRQGRRHVLPADDPDRRPTDRPGLLQRGLRAARRGLPVPRLRRGDRGVNDSMFGLQTGVFTNDLAGAWRAFASSRSAASSSTTSRPTGSTTCRTAASRTPARPEGLRWAIEDMTEIRIMVLAQPGLTSSVVPRGTTPDRTSPLTPPRRV